MLDTMSYKIIFDSSVFDIEALSKLEQSSFKKAIAYGRISFYMTPIFINECLDFISDQKVPQKIISKLSFIHDLKWQRIFNEVGGQEGIYTRELEGELLPSEYLFTPNVWIKKSIHQIIRGGELTQTQKDSINLLRSRLRRIKEEARGVLCQLRGNEKPVKDVSFQDCVSHSFERIAITKIENRIDSRKSKDGLLKFWKSNMHRCPHFNKFVETEVFMLWVALQERDLKIDLNGFEDAEHLVYLNDVDGIVSREQKFMKRLSENIFPNKDYFSIDEFIQFVNQ